jgi:putative mRNA 3-end processing factor
VRCHTFVTESTFGLPIYRWAPQERGVRRHRRVVARQPRGGEGVLLYAYALGKAQRLLAGRGPVHRPDLRARRGGAAHGDYRDTGVPLPPTRYAGGQPRGYDWSRALIVAPPSAHGTPWMRRFGAVSTAFASGWMRVRGQRRRRSVDRGFVLSDHVDWPSLLAAIDATGAERVWVTHGYREPVVRWLRERGLEAKRRRQPLGGRGGQRRRGDRAGGGRSFGRRRDGRC